MYIPKSEFGWNRRTGWLHGDEASYNNAVALMKTVQPGRQRNRPIHQSWEPVLKHFDSSNPIRSQGAFCRYINKEPATKGYWKNGLTPAMLSAAKTKQITEQMHAWIHRWAYDSRKEVEGE